MTSMLSENTKAILLLTAPLTAGGSKSSTKLLSLGEYKRLALHLRELKRQPSDFLNQDAKKTLQACNLIIDENRLQSLLERGFQLSQAFERWQSHAIWVVSRADADYPKRLKQKLRENAPAIVYGCGSKELLDTGGLAVVGSRDVDDALITYTKNVGKLVASSGKKIVSGGAKGVDTAAMQGAWETGGCVCGVLANNLERQTTNRSNRDLLLNHKMVLISHCDPSAGFNVGNAMQRNKLIYALADAALVVNSDVKGGTWTGAVEQLEKLKFLPIHVRSTGSSTAGLDALRAKGALEWPNPSDADSLEAVFNVTVPSSNSSTSPQSSFSLDPDDNMGSDGKVVPDYRVSENSSANNLIKEQKPDPVTHKSTESLAKNSPPSDQAPDELLFAKVSELIQPLLTSPKTSEEVAAALNVSKTQATQWLNRLAEEGSIDKTKRPVRYVVKGG